MRNAPCTDSSLKFLTAHELAAAREAQRLEDTPEVKQHCICRPNFVIDGQEYRAICPSCLLHGKIVRAVPTIPLATRERRQVRNRHIGHSAMDA